MIHNTQTFYYVQWKEQCSWCCEGFGFTFWSYYKETTSYLPYASSPSLIKWRQLHLLPRGCHENERRQKRSVECLEHGACPNHHPSAVCSSSRLFQCLCSFSQDSVLPLGRRCLIFLSISHTPSYIDDQIAHAQMLPKLYNYFILKKSSIAL